MEDDLLSVMTCTSDPWSRAAAAAAYVDSTSFHTELADISGDMFSDLSRTRSHAAVAAACVDPTSLGEGMAATEGRLNGTVAP